MAKYKNKYRGQTTRASWWNYGWNGAYFITICTKNREHFFGKISNGKMELSHTGVIADIFWYDITNHFSFAELGEFVVMPNHIHGIVILDRPADPSGLQSGLQSGLPSEGLLPLALPPEKQLPSDELLPPVRALHATPPQLQPPQLQPPQSLPPRSMEMAAISPKPNSISTIIRSYKSALTKHSNRLGFPNGWQSRFHDHIIRDEAEYQRIANYILNNPSKWKEDKFY